MSSPNNSRITARLPEHAKSIIEKAAGIQGSNLNQFMVQASLQVAREIIETEQKFIEREQSIRLTSEDIGPFLDILENPSKPTDKLIRASKRHKECIKGA